MINTVVIVLLLGLWATSLIDNYYMKLKLKAAGDMITDLSKTLKNQGYDKVAYAD